MAEIGRLQLFRFGIICRKHLELIRNIIHHDSGTDLDRGWARSTWAPEYPNDDCLTVFAAMTSLNATEGERHENDHGGHQAF